MPGNPAHGRAAPGVYTVTATHVVDTSKTATVQVFVDYGIPSTVAEVVTGSGGTSSSSLEAAYDLNASNYAYLQCYVDTGYLGSSKNDVSMTTTYSGFPSYVSNSTTLKINCQSFSAFTSSHLAYKVGAGAPVSLSNFPLTQSTLSYALPNSININTLSIIIDNAAYAIFNYDVDIQQWVLQESGGTSGDLFEFWLETSSAYVAALDHVAPGTGTGKKIYPSNLYSTVTGVLSTPTTSVTANYVIDGTNGYWFITNA